MVDYWQYKAVHYWANVISRKRTFCLDEGFFKVAEVLCEKERIIELIRGEMTEELLHEMQNESVSYRPKPAEYIPDFTSGERMFSFSKSCSRSSFTWQRRMTRPPHAFTTSDMICAAIHDFPPPTDTSMQGFVFFSRRWRYVATTASCW